MSPLRRRLLVPSLVLCASAGFAAEPTATERPDAAPGTGAQVGKAIGDGVDGALKSLRFGAYGELHYNNFQGADSHNGQGAATTGRDMIELHRFVLLGEAQLAKNIGFVFELEFEHAFAQNNQGEVELEQCYLDFGIATGHSIRAGMMLVPISIGNLHHEPTTFHGVERPEFDRIVVPTTWFESGVSLNGEVTSQLGYVVAVQAAPNAANYRAQDAIRAGRERGYKSSADDLMATARVDWRPLAGLWLAAAGTYAQGNRDEQVTNVDSALTLYTLEARYQHFGWDAGVSWGQGFIRNADIHPNTTATNPVAETFSGLSAYLAYDVLSLITASDQQVFLFARYEDIDLQAEVPTGRTANKAYQSQVFQVGVTWKVTPNVVVKADYRDYENEAENAVDSWNLGLGFAF